MKAFMHRAGFAVVLVLAGGIPANSQLLDHLRALSVTRYPVGDPSITATNHFGDPEEGPKDIAVADIDGDGKVDFAASNKDGSVTVYFGLGNGTFEPALHLRTWTSAPADASGIVLIKLLTNACISVLTNSWEQGGTNNTNWTWVCVPGTTNITTNLVSISDGPTGLRGLAIADFTGDARRDIAVASPGESVIYLLVNEGERHFAPAMPVPGWLGVRDLAAGDFDGDGRCDLAASGTTNGVVQYRSLGVSGFEVVTNIMDLGTGKLDHDFPQPAFYMKSFRPPDTTRDELAVGRAQGGAVRVLAPNAAGLLEVQNTLSNVVVHALDVGPVLQARTDGIPDLVTVNHSDDSLEIYAGLADSRRFETNASRTVLVPGRAHGVAIVDLDHDGWNDVIVVLQRFAKIQIFRNNQGQFELASEIPVGAGPRELSVGDFNGDERGDAAILNRVSEDVSVLTAHPTQFGFQSLDMLYPSDGEVVSLQVYDFNGDGRDDVVQLHRAAGELSVRLARPDGTLSDPVFYGLGTTPSDTRTVDVNHDQVLDVLAVDLAGFVTVRLGKGDGTFGPEIRTSLREYADGSWGGGQLFSLTTGDFDGDGNVDVAAGYLDCRVGLFRGNGDGTFFHTHTHLLGYETHGLATGDFDQDGDIDLVATPWDGTLIVVNNHGDLLTTTNLDRTVITNSHPNSGAWTIVVTDYNHDNDPDLLVDGSEGYTLYLGGPGLTFIWTTNILSQTGTVPSISPVTGDFNGDGFEDVIAACLGSSCVSVSLGNADGGFEDAFAIRVPSSGLLATGDIDGDGMPDLVGTGDVLWTALSSRPPGPAVPPPPGVLRQSPGKPLINEVLAANDSIALAADEGHTSDYVELFNGGGAPLPLLDWTLRLERTNSSGVWLTNEFQFPTNAIIDVNSYLLLICSDKLRTPFHTGFNLPAEGGSLCLVAPDHTEADRINYPAQKPDHAYARFQDGVNGFVTTDTPTPGRPNVDTGLAPPKVSLMGLDPATLEPERPLRFFAHAEDDLGIVNLSVLWRRLDIPDDVTKRVILYDDGMNGDGAFQDGMFSGVFPQGLPAGAEIQFYLECLDLSGQTDSAPGNPRFVAPGETPLVYTLVVGALRSALEISEVVADNETGLQDENGGTPDWLEIRNDSAEPVSLAGVSLGQTFFGEAERMSFEEGAMIGPGQHMVIFADNKPEQGLLHARFKLNRDGDHLFLTGTSARGGRSLIDVVMFGMQKPDVALARLGARGPWIPNAPTPRAGNVNGRWQSLVQSNTFTLAFPTSLGRRYTVEYKDSLDEDSWRQSATALGTGVEMTVRDELRPQRFLRVREE